ncbi:MAG TPA: hypothetical protein VII76_02220 [Acidimicrobiales bacterium]
MSATELVPSERRRTRTTVAVDIVIHVHNAVEQLVAFLSSNASKYSWVAATSGSASGYELATGDPVMAIGGFNVTDPAPTLSQFERYVSEGRIHYDIGGGGNFQRFWARARLVGHLSLNSDLPVGEEPLHGPYRRRSDRVRPHCTQVEVVIARTDRIPDGFADQGLPGLETQTLPRKVRIFDPPFHAASSYSWISPPRRSRRRMCR